MNSNLREVMHTLAGGFFGIIVMAILHANPPKLETEPAVQIEPVQIEPVQIVVECHIYGRELHDRDRPTSCTTGAN